MAIRQRAKIHRNFSPGERVADLTMVLNCIYERRRRSGSRAPALHIEKLRILVLQPAEGLALSPTNEYEAGIDGAP